jgi:hypothetical protein
VDWLHNSDEANLVTFLRADDKDELLVVINFSGRPLSGKVDLKNVDGFVPVEISGARNSKAARCRHDSTRPIMNGAFIIAPLIVTSCGKPCLTGIRTS